MSVFINLPERLNFWKVFWSLFFSGRLVMVIGQLLFCWNGIGEEQIFLACFFLFGQERVNFFGTGRGHRGFLMHHLVGLLWCYSLGVLTSHVVNFCISFLLRACIRFFCQSYCLPLHLSRRRPGFFKDWSAFELILRHLLDFLRGSSMRILFFPIKWAISFLRLLPYPLSLIPLTLFLLQLRLLIFSLHLKCLERRDIRFFANIGVSTFFRFLVWTFELFYCLFLCVYIVDRLEIESIKLVYKIS